MDGLLAVSTILLSLWLIGFIRHRIRLSKQRDRVEAILAKLNAERPCDDDYSFR